MNHYTKILKSVISSSLVILITANCLAHAKAARPDNPQQADYFSSESGALSVPNPDGGFTVTENTTIDQAINLWGNILVKSGYTLTVNGKFVLSSGTLTIETGATVIVNNTLEISGGKLALAGGRIFMTNLSVHQNNQVTGNGGIKIEGSFSNESSPGWPV